MIDVTIVATAIKVEFWKEYYLNLTKNNASFHLVFTGPKEPNFRLPSNFTFLLSDEKPTACVQKSYNYVYKNLETKYIMHTADDFLFQENYLDRLIEGYKKNSKLYPDRPVMVTQMSIGPGGSWDRMGLADGEPALGIGPLTTIKNDKLVGKIDGRFNSVCWDMDRLYRFYSLGGIMIILTEDECPPVKERGGKNVNYAWSQHHQNDLKVLNQLWQKSEPKGDIFLNYWNGLNSFERGSFKYSRIEDTISSFTQEKEK